jgi:hypothetical protein
LLPGRDTIIVGAWDARRAEEARVVREDLRRAFALAAKVDMGGARTEVSPFGLAVFDEPLPPRYDSNYLLSMTGNYLLSMTGRWSEAHAACPNWIYQPVRDLL